MEPLYYQTPYVKEFDAIVTACRPAKHGFEVELSQTGFYPEGGGQPSDTGRIGEVHVTHVEEKHGVVVHETDAPLEVGSTVHAAIDWEQRFSNMQQHTGEHIISGLIHAAYGYDNVGFHMGHDEVTVDLNGPLNWEQLKEIEKKANAVVWANLPAQVTYPGGGIENDRLPQQERADRSGPHRRDSGGGYLCLLRHTRGLHGRDRRDQGAFPDELQGRRAFLHALW